MTEEPYLKCLKLTVLSERLFEAYRWWQQGELLNGGDFDFDESNDRLDEIVDVHLELAIARREWVASMPDERRQRAHASFRQYYQRQMDDTKELLEDLGAWEDLITQVDASTTKVSSDEHR